jgi:hypothetical protein
MAQEAASKYINANEIDTVIAFNSAVPAKTLLYDAIKYIQSDPSHLIIECDSQYMFLKVGINVAFKYEGCYNGRFLKSVQYRFKDGRMKVEISYGIHAAECPLLYVGESESPIKPNPSKEDIAAYKQLKITNQIWNIMLVKLITMHIENLHKNDW